MIDVAEGLPPVEAFLWRIDEEPFRAIARFMVGLGMLPLWHALFGRNASGRSLVFVFLAILALIRLFPIGFRWLVPFSESVRHAWASRRLMAKRYDSYQWQKLFWTGLGLVVSIVWSNDFGMAPGILAITCLAAGALGTVAWRRRKALIATAATGAT